MARCKNVNWSVADSETCTVSIEYAQLAVLMDIRDELQALNRTLGCYRVRQGMDALHRLDKRVAKRWPLNRRKK